MLSLFGEALSSVVFPRDSSHIVDTGYAKFRGNFTEPFSLAFLGVPYAEPPVGDLRFRAPVPLDTEKLKGNGGVIDATSYPNFCVQGSIGEGDAGGAGSEDCLKINIYTPVNATSKSKLPVLFYIHGGGYVYGNPRNWPFEHWINQSPNVVVVSVYYRLDSFGFLAHPDFSNPSIADLNAGMKDQLLALRWVHDNIEAFGGDPDQVTINGQSAGGGSVEIHMIANEGSEKLFSGAIAQSVDREILPLPEQQEPLFDFYAEQAGCGGLSSVSATVSCLRKASISALARAQDAGASFNGSLYNKWRPVVDGSLIPDYPTKLLAEGRFLHVPLIAGATSNETGGGTNNLTAVLHPAYPLLNAAELEKFNQVYNPAQFSSEEEWIRTATGEPGLRCGREMMGAAGVKNSKAWTYRYNQPNPTQNEPGITEHAAENWMMFLGTNTGTNGSTVFTGLDPVETAFSEELIAYWLSFVRTKDPNTFKLERSPFWPDFSTNKRAVLQQDQQNETRASSIFVEEEDAAKSRCAFVASVVEHMQD
ncbi:alpha/beta-hydrolase [Fomitiporia mediterranea MF3/22]|uniref:alpha/beta-hydrolase n=1 Tax=Fomitiporia mediterranea (strain MF3/22) TaxID=694068 RepID=UPI0004408A23|nr:alpha/beta-hydrolase [Fomitiporia mediterranea MF3/22]EJD02053.1 alpha/beta-hydrolase [Fomitiporia mediterranea MF3/22]